VPAAHFVGRKPELTFCWRSVGKLRELAFDFLKHAIPGYDKILYPHYSNFLPKIAVKLSNNTSQ